MMFFWFYCFVISVAIVKSNYCPLEGEIPNCRCKSSSDAELQVYCSNISELNTFQIQMTKFVGQNVSILLLQNFTMPYLPSSALRGISIRSIELHGGELNSLGHPGQLGSPFEGLEDSLVTFTAFRVEQIGLFDFSVFKNFNKVERLDVQFSPIDKFDGWPTLHNTSRLKFFTIADTNLTILETRLLSQNDNLSMLVMIQNKITTLHRDFFPNPATKLMDIMFGGNEISFIDDNVFENMPALRYIDLSDNKLATVSEYWFRPVWSDLHGLQIRGNPLHCDSTLAWFTNVVQSQNKQLQFDDFKYSKCASPKKLANRTVVSITRSDLQFDGNNNID